MYIIVIIATKINYGSRNTHNIEHTNQIVSSETKKLYRVAIKLARARGLEIRLSSDGTGQWPIVWVDRR